MKRRAVMVDLTISPDDVCEVCGTVRDEHGDKMHKFSTDGQLIPLEQGKPPAKEAPRHRDDPPPTSAGVGPDLGMAFATLIEVLAEKQISFDGVGRELLTKQDIIRIFSGKG
jgi:hypothetical protein